jgi:hypothetical protein
VIGVIPRRLRLVFGRPEMGQTVGEPALAASRPPTVEFTAYSSDCRASAGISLDGNRLTDILNAHDEFELVDVLVETLEDGHAIEAHDLVVGRDELYAVHVGGPRGDPGRRVRPARPRSPCGSARMPSGATPTCCPVRTPSRASDIVAPWSYSRMPGSSTTRPTGASWRGPKRTWSTNRDLTDWVGLAADEDIKLAHWPGRGEAGSTGQVGPARA